MTDGNHVFRWMFVPTWLRAATLAALTCCAPLASPQAQRAGDAGGAGDCTVRRIIDGDTIECVVGRSPLSVRLLGIDAPEMRQGEYGRPAREHLAKLLAVGSLARLELDVRETDRYGRVLAYVWNDSEAMVNESMLRAGLAVVDIRPPNVRYAELLRRAAAEARAKGSGLWGTPAFDCTPADFRRKRCG